MYPKTMTLKAGKNNPRLPICRGNNGAGPGVHLLPPVKGAIPFPGTTWRIGQEVKTPPFHGGNAGSIPARATMLPCWTWLKMLAGPSALMGKSYLLKWME